MAYQLIRLNRAEAEESEVAVARLLRAVEDLAARIAALEGADDAPKAKPKEPETMNARRASLAELDRRMNVSTAAAPVVRREGTKVFFVPLTQEQARAHVAAKAARAKGRH